MLQAQGKAFFQLVRANKSPYIGDVN